MALVKEDHHRKGREIIHTKQELRGGARIADLLLKKEQRRLTKEATQTRDELQKNQQQLEELENMKDLSRGQKSKTRVIRNMKSELEGKIRRNRIAEKVMIAIGAAYAVGLPVGAAEATGPLADKVLLALFGIGVGLFCGKFAKSAHDENKDDEKKLYSLDQYA